MTSDKVFDDLEVIITMCSRMKFIDAEKAYKLIQKEYTEHNKIDKQLLEDAEYLLCEDYKSRDQSHAKSYRIYKKILKGVFDKRTTTGKKVMLIQDKKKRLETLENSLGVIFDELKVQKSKKSFMILLCMGHVIRYEAFASSDGVLRRKFIELINIGLDLTKEERNKLIEGFFSIRGFGNDGKSDTWHIRNAIAHGRFEFVKDDVIKFTDVDKDGKITFERELNDGDLFGLFNMFEMKLRFVLLYSKLAELNAAIKEQSIEYM